jgi:hypothetical protein
VIESLKRAIEKAHRNHLQSQPSQDEPQSSVSLPEHPSKRRKTAVDVSSRSSMKDGSHKKEVPVTYGKRSKTIFTSSPTFADPPTDQPDSHALVVDIAPSEATWNLEGTMRDEYAQHEPAIFPEPSSTVPNATMTQQRVLDVVNAPAMLGQEFDAARPRFVPPPEPSVPFSDLWKFTPGEAGDESFDHAPASDLPSATPHWTSQRTSQRTSQTNLELPTSQRSRRGSSARPKESPLKSEVFRAEVANMGQKPLLFEASLAPVSELPPTAPSISSRSQEIRDSPRQRKSKAAVVVSSNDDLTAIGLPKEQYRPRPSRSRSLKVDAEQPIDYSVKPEKAKKVSKRRKTTTAVADTNVITTPQKVQQICDMGFTPSTTGAALERNNGDVTQTVNWLLTNNIGHDELAPQSPPKTKSTPRKDDEMPVVDHETIQNIMRNLNEYRRDDTQTPHTVQSTVANNATISKGHSNDAAASLTTIIPSDGAPVTSPTKVQVVIPKRLPNTRASNSIDVSTKKPKRRKQTREQPNPEPVTEPSVLPDDIPEVIPEKKKGCGRPKKAANTATSTKVVPETQDQSMPAQEPDEVLKTIEPNVVSGNVNMALESPAEEAQVLEPSESKTATHDPNPPSKISPAVASETPERWTKPTSASPSITKGKVPYRVGLSKRARIAPLLRIMKK